MRALLIAEKPDLKRHVEAVYKKYGHKDIIDFESFAGHTMTLKDAKEYDEKWSKWNIDNLPMIPEHFKYKVAKGKEDIYKRIRKKIKDGNYDYLINCCDPGREGEHIFFSFYEGIDCKLPVKRMWHSDLTENELKRALNNFRDENEPELKNMIIASKLRADFDWLTGINFTVAFTLKTGAEKPCSVGRVMTPTLKIIVDRELELKNFVSKDFWEIEGKFDGYTGTYYTEDGKGQFLDKAKAESIIKSLGKKGIIESIEKKKEVKYAPKLHSLAELQNEANKVYGYTMQETLGLVQKLYEKKILSYPRTDSSYVTKSIAKDFGIILSAVLNVAEYKDIAQSIINNKAVLTSIINNKRYVDDKKVSDHYAIIPTGEDFVFSSLPQNEQNIVRLVFKRLLAIFLPPLTLNKTNIVTKVDDAIFKTTGSVLVDKGFTILYGTQINDNTLPNLNKGDSISVKSIDLIAKKTSPPARYTDETLNKSMENAGKFIDNEELKEVLKEAKGLGTPATRGGIVEKLVNLNMIERKKKNFYATDYGVSIIQALGDFEITSPELTGVWEQKLRQIEACSYNPNQFSKEMIEFVKCATEKLKSLNCVVDSCENSIGKCPECGKSIKEGKSYYFCCGYKKDCDFIVAKNILGAKISKTELKKLIEGKQTKVLKFTKNEKEWSCPLVYSKTNKKIEFVMSNSSNKDLGKCPCCGKPMKEGKSYYYCSDYKKGCNFIFNKEMSGFKFKEKDVKELLANKKIKRKFIWKSGKQGEATLVIKDNMVKFDF